MANQYDVGRIIRLSTTFTTSTGAAFDPATIIAVVKDPSGAVTSYQYGSSAEVIRDATGQYHVDIETTLPGIWYYRWYATGAQKASNQSHFKVRKVEAQ